MDNLQAQLNELAMVRAQAAETAAKVREMEEAFRQANATVYDEAAQMKAWQGELEAAIREAAVGAYEANPSTKAVAPGVGIRVVTNYQYDPDEAFGWAKAHGIALQLNHKEFKGICKTETRPDFVGIKTQATATIATDLSKHGYGKED